MSRDKKILRFLKSLEKHGIAADGQTADDGCDITSFMCDSKDVHILESNRHILYDNRTNRGILTRPGQEHIKDIEEKLYKDRSQRVRWEILVLLSLVSIYLTLKK